jgi:predicted PurR-regulated permease PerM
MMGRRTESVLPVEEIDSTTASPPGDVLRTPIDVRSAALSLLAFVALVFALKAAQEVFIPIVLAALIGYALEPVVSRLVRLKFHRAIASGLVLTALTCGLAACAWGVRGQFMAALEQLPDVAQRLRQSVRSALGSGDASALGKIRKAATEIEKTATEAVGGPKSTTEAPRVKISEPAFDANEYLLSGSKQVLSLAGQALTIFFLVYFLLAAGDLYKRKIVKITGTTLSEKKVTVEIINEINAQIGQFLLVQAATSGVVAVVTWLSLWAIGLNQPAVWGIAAGIFNSVPYFGAIFVAAGIFVVGLLQGGLAMAVLAGAIAFVITTLEGSLLTPALLGRAAKMNQVAVFISLLFWSWVWGIVGMILAVPLMMAIKTVCDRIEDLQPVGELLGEK